MTTMGINISRRKDVEEMVKCHSRWANRCLFKIFNLLERKHKVLTLTLLDLKVNSLFTILQFYFSKVVCHTPEHKKFLLLLV